MSWNPYFWEEQEAYGKALCVGGALTVLSIVLSVTGWLPVNFMTAFAWTCIICILSWPVFGILQRIDDRQWLATPMSDEAATEMADRLDRQDREEVAYLGRYQEALNRSESDFQSRLKAQIKAGDRRDLTALVQEVSQQPRVAAQLAKQLKPSKRKVIKRRKTA